MFIVYFALIFTPKLKISKIKDLYNLIGLLTNTYKSKYIKKFAHLHFTSKKLKVQLIFYYDGNTDQHV